MSKQTSRFDRNGAAKQQRKNLGRVNEPHFMKGELALILIDGLRHLNGSASKKAIEREIAHFARPYPTFLSIFLFPHRVHDHGVVSAPTPG